MTSSHKSDVHPIRSPNPQDVEIEPHREHYIMGINAQFVVPLILVVVFGTIGILALRKLAAVTRNAGRCCLGVSMRSTR